MAKILSQDEIDSFLGGAATAGGPPRVPLGRAPVEDAVVYDFRRPERVSREQMGSLRFLYDRFARNSSTALSAYLRIATDISVLSVQQLTYSEFLASLPDPTAFYAVGLDPLEGAGALELNPELAFPMIDRMLGGRGEGGGEERPLTDIEQNIVDDVVLRLLEQMTDVWRGVYAVRFEIKGRETQPDMLRIAEPSDPMVLLVCSVQLPEAKGILNFAMPTSAVEQTGTSVVRSWQQTQREPTPADRERLFANLSRVPLTLTAGLETIIPASDVLSFKPGDVVSLGRPVTDPIDVRVGDVRKFTGTPMVSEGNAAVEIAAPVGGRVSAKEAA